MIKVFYDGLVVVKIKDAQAPVASKISGLFDISKHLKNRFELIGHVVIDYCTSCELGDLTYFFTDKDGNPTPFTLTTDKIQDIHENGNALKLIFDDEPPVDVAPTEKEFKESERNTTLNIIYGLLELLKSGGKSQNEIISELERFGYRGLKKSTLETYFSKANKIHERG